MTELETAERIVKQKNCHGVDCDSDHCHAEGQCSATGDASIDGTFYHQQMAMAFFTKYVETYHDLERHHIDSRSIRRANILSSLSTD